MSSSTLLFPDPCVAKMDTYAMCIFELFAQTSNSLRHIQGIINEYENYQLFIASVERAHGKDIEMIFILYCFILNKEGKLIPLIERLQDPRRLQQSAWKPRQGESPIYHLVRLLNTLLEPPQQ